MDYADLQKFFKESALGQVRWLSELEKETHASEAQKAQVARALELFARYAPRVEEEAFYQADARLRDYEGTEFFRTHRSTIEAAYVATGYSKLAMALSLLLREA